MPKKIVKKEPAAAKAKAGKAVKKSASKKEAVSKAIPKKSLIKKPSLKSRKKKTALFIEPNPIVCESVFQKETVEVVQDREHDVVIFIKKTLPTLHRIFFIACVSVFFLTLTLVSLSVFAQQETPKGALYNDQLKNVGTVAYGQPTESIGVIVAKVIQVILGLLGLIFLILIIYAGFLWMTDKGDEEQAKKSRQMILNSIIGVLIVIAAYAMTDWVLNQLIESIKAP